MEQWTKMNKELKTTNRPVCDIFKISHYLLIKTWHPSVCLLKVMNKAGVSNTMTAGRHIRLKLGCTSTCMCTWVCASFNNPAHNLAGSQRPWADCYHGNLTASIFFGPHFSLWTAGPWQTSRLRNLAYREHMHESFACVCVCFVGVW